MSGINQNSCILAVVPSTKGFGFAVLDGERLVDWGIKTAEGDKNRESLRKIKLLITRYKPGALVLEDYAAKGSRRSDRIKSLGSQIVTLARRYNVSVRMLSRPQVKKTFLADGKGNKDAVAEVIAKRFPDELAFRLPRKRRLWTSEAYQMGIFDAVALVLMLRQGN